MTRRNIGTFARAAALALALMASKSAYAQTLQAVASPGELGFDVARLERVGKVFQGYIDAKKLPGAVILIARDDKVAYFQALGFQDREKQIAMTTNSIFRIASMTKPIVTAAAMTLGQILSGLEVEPVVLLANYHTDDPVAETKRVKDRKRALRREAGMPATTS